MIEISFLFQNIFLFKYPFIFFEGFLFFFVVAILKDLKIASHIIKYLIQLFLSFLSFLFNIFFFLKIPFHYFPLFFFSPFSIDFKNRRKHSRTWRLECCECTSFGMVPKWKSTFLENSFKFAYKHKTNRIQILHSLHKHKWFVVGANCKQNFTNPIPNCE